MKDFETWFNDFKGKAIDEDGKQLYSEDFSEIETIHQAMSTGLEEKDKEIDSLKEENTKLKDRVWKLYESQSIENKPIKQDTKSAIEKLFE